MGNQFSLNMKKILYKQYIDILSARHPNFKLLINVVGELDYEIPVWNLVEDAVVYAVIGQMLSASATNSITKRLSETIGSSKEIIYWASQNSGKPGPIMGVSQRKRRAFAEWSYYSKNKDSLNWPKLPLLEFRNEVKKIWGFGDWAADMLAIFHLGRMDVWPETDNGIKKASKIVFGTHNDKYIKKCISGCESVAALYLWELLNKKLIRDFENKIVYG